MLPASGHAQLGSGAKQITMVFLIFFSLIIACLKYRLAVLRIRVSL